MNTNNGFWQTDRGKALIKLLLWMVFIVILIVLAIVSERNGNSEILDVDKPENNTTDTPREPENVEYEAYNTMITNLLANNYEYEYLITTATDSIILTGFKNPDKEIGFKETSSGITKYFIDSTGTYELNMNTSSIIDNLYSEFDSSYLNLELLFNNLSEYLYNTEENVGIRTITYDKDGFQVTVTTDTKNITNVLVMTDTTTYDLNFKNIGECATIDFILSDSVKSFMEN